MLGSIASNIEWSDGRVEFRRASWVDLDRPDEVDLSVRVVGLFTDGSEVTLFESKWRGPGELPFIFIPAKSKSWSLWAMAACCVYALWIARRSQRLESLSA